MLLKRYLRDLLLPPASRTGRLDALMLRANRLLGLARTPTMNRARNRHGGNQALVAGDLLHVGGVIMSLTHVYVSLLLRLRELCRSGPICTPAPYALRPTPQQDYLLVSIQTCAIDSYNLANSAQYRDFLDSQ